MPAVGPKVQRDGILAIDLGSTYARIGIRDSQKFYHVVLPTNERDEGLHFFGAHGQIPAISRPMVNDWRSPKNIGTKEAMFLPGALPVKYSLYKLAGWKKSQLSGMPQIHSLYENSAPANIDNRLRETLKIFLKGVTDRARALSQARSIAITRVALTYPPVWDSNLMRLYSELVEEFFPEINTNEFHLVSEAEACAWTIWENNPSWLRDYRWHLVVDVGGHTMNGTLMAILPVPGAKDDQIPKICCPGKAFGAHGCGERWNHLVIEYMKDVFKDPDDQAHEKCLSDKISKCLKSFINQKQALSVDEDYRFTLQCALDPDQEHVLCIPAHKMKELLGEAFQEALELFEKQFEAAIKVDSKDLNVVLCGGSVMNKEVRALFEAIVAERAKITLLDETLSQLEWQYGQADGAAIACSNLKGVKEFLADAGLGIQFTSYPGNAKDSEIWSWDVEELPVEYRGEHRARAQKDITFVEKARLKLVCDPFYQHRVNTSGNLNLFSCYDFWVDSDRPEEGKAFLRLAGEYRLTVDFVFDKPVAGEGLMRCKLERRNRLKNTWTAKRCDTMNLYFRAGDNTASVDHTSLGTGLQFPDEEEPGSRNPESHEQAIHQPENTKNRKGKGTTVGRKDSILDPDSSSEDSNTHHKHASSRSRAASPVVRKSSRKRKRTNLPGEEKPEAELPAMLSNPVIATAKASSSVARLSGHTIEYAREFRREPH